MAKYIPLGGSSRRYLNTETGETISRDAFHKIQTGLGFKQATKQRRERGLKEVLARPARGRTRATTQTEAQLRYEAELERQAQLRRNLLERQAGRKSRRVRVKKIRPHLLKPGRMAERIDFSDWNDLEDLRKQMMEYKLPSGRRLIFAYGVGIVGYDERTGKEIAATLFPLRTPSSEISEDDFYEVADDFVLDRAYFIPTNFYLHLQFDKRYATEKAKRK